MKTQARQQNSKGPQTELDRVYSRSQDETRRLISSLMVDEGEDQSVAESVEKEHAPVAFEPTPLLRKSQVAFATILLLNDAAMVQILKKLDWDLLAFALKGTPDMVQDQFFRNLDARAVALVQGFMTCLGPISQTEVIQAQQEILAIIRNLQQKASGFS